MVPLRQRFWISDMEAVLAIMVILIILGTINIFSASFIVAETQYHNPYFFLMRQLLSLGIGILALIFSIRLDYHHWRKLIPFVMVFTIGALLAVLLVGVEVNGSKRWLGLGFMQFQPSEMAKLVSIVMAAAYLGPRIDRNQKITLKNIPAVIFVVMAVLVELQPDMGTMLLVLGIPMLMYILAGMETKWVSMLACAGAVMVILLSFLQPYRLERIKTWYDPWQYQQDQGYQTVQSMSAIGSGGFLGMGLGKGVSKYYYLPEAHTDFAFAIFCQENGYVGAFFMFFLLVALAIYSGKIANRAVDGFGRMLASGVLILIVGQAVANISMVVGLIPVVGVPLPFISYGGTSLILNMVGIGLLVNVGSYASKHPIEAKAPVIEEMPRHRLRLVKK
jgi:cell division protein FtsW